MARREGPTDDLLALGDVEPALGLGAPSQGDVRQRDVVLEPRVGGVGDRDRHPHTVVPHGAALAPATAGARRSRRSVRRTRRA